MSQEYVALIAYAVQSHGPIASGLMLEGSAHLAADLAASGYRPRVYDFNTVATIERIAREGKAGFLDWVIDYLSGEIDHKQIRLLGFTLYTNGFKDCLEIAGQLKRRHPGLMIAAGGPLVGWLGRTIFEFTDVFDVLVPGEGDTAIVHLADCAYRGGRLRDVPGALYHGASGVITNPRIQEDMTVRPFPLYAEDIYPFFQHKLPVSTLRTSVGCSWGRCSFCIQPKLDGRPRDRQLDNVLAEIEYLSGRYGIQYFRLADPSPDPQRIGYLAEHLSDEVYLSGFLYPDAEPDLSWTRGHVISLFIGLERTAPDDLLALGKTNRPEIHTQTAFELVRQAKSLGIATCLTNIVPIANDSLTAIIAHREALIAANPDCTTVTPLLPIPGSVLYRKVLKDRLASGVVLEPDFEYKLAMWELDLLHPLHEWPPAPWKLVVDGLPRDPFAVAQWFFVRQILEAGTLLASDEIVLMASMYYGGLETDQPGRRAKITAFHTTVRDAIRKGQSDVLKRILSQSRSPHT